MSGKEKIISFRVSPSAFHCQEQFENFLLFQDQLKNKSDFNRDAVIMKCLSAQDHTETEHRQLMKWVEQKGVHYVLQTLENSRSKIKTKIDPQEIIEIANIIISRLQHHEVKFNTTIEENSNDKPAGKELNKLRKFAD